MLVAWNFKWHGIQLRLLDIAKPAFGRKKKRNTEEKYPPNFLPSASYYNCQPLQKSIFEQETRQPQLCSPRYEMHRAEQGRLRFDRRRENAFHSCSFRVHSQCHGKRGRGGGMLSATLLLKAANDFPSHQWRNCVFSEICKPYRGAPYFSNFSCSSHRVSC